MRDARGRLILAVLTAVAVLPLFPPSPARAQNGTWSALVGDSTAPGPRREYGAIYDDQHARYLIFAGFYGDLQGTYQLFNEVWTLSLGATPAWSRLVIPGPVPGERHSPQWGYDAANNRVLVFGGYGRHYPGAPYEYLNDVWQLSLDGTPQWTELMPAGTPPSGRLAGAAVYDPMRERFVGFGGTIGLPVDTWVLDLAGQPAWIPLPTDSTGPPGSYGMTSIYDAVRDRMVIFGGSTSDGYYGVHNDVWELTLRGRPTWNKLAPAGPAPVPRRTGTAIFDPLRDRMIIYGGWDSTENGTASFLGDTWALSFSGTPQWTQLAPGGVIPAGRDAMAAAYDPIGDRMVVFGGWGGYSMLGDTQFLSWGGSGVPASLTPTADADPGVARLRWSLQDATGSYAAVYRRDASTPWTSIATVEADGAGVVTFEDHAVIDGQNYGYMLVVASQRGETFGGETWVTIPSPVGVGPGSVPAFALHGVAPNPAVDRFGVSFALPGAEPATLELFDLAGRRWLSREVGSLGAGVHRLEIGSAGQFPPGMYFLRLTQRRAAATARVVVTGSTATR